MWSAYLSTEVTPTDVAQMMVLLKVVRGQANNKHLDNFVDQAGYSALGFEVAE
jgi:arginine repressor